MFLRKLFSSENKFTWVLIDLFIVIVGVYCAFLIQNYAENEKNLKERDRIITAMKYEMEAFRFQMTEISLGMRRDVRIYNSYLNQQTYPNFSDARFIEPQYEYQSIEYALKLQNSAIIDFELYLKLQSIFVEIKKIEHVERLLTETARRYRTIPESITSSSQEFQLLKAENLDNFLRYKILTRDRGEVSGRLSLATSDALTIINERLGPKRAKKIEEELILGYAPNFDNEEQAIQIGLQYFPHFTEEEMASLYRQANGLEETPTDSTSSRD